jgi:hypothetical protein
MSNNQNNQTFPMPQLRLNLNQDAPVPEKPKQYYSPVPVSPTTQFLWSSPKEKAQLLAKNNQSK